MSDEQFGLIHIYCGAGKGKTTAAVGLCIRALGRGKKVLFVQFLKGWDSGELHILSQLDNIKIMRGKPSTKFTFQMNDSEKLACLQAHNELFAQIKEYLNTNAVDLLIMDELLGTYTNNLIDRAAVVEFLKSKPVGLEVVLTGRNPAPELIELADYLSEIHKVKHPFDQGIRARVGIEK